MKRFDELNERQKEAAVIKCCEEVIKAAVEIGPDFFPPELEPLAVKAWRAAEDMQTPWFVHEYLLDEEKIKEFFTIQAAEDAKSTFYLEPGEFAIYLPPEVWA